MTALGDYTETAFLNAMLRGVNFTSPGTTYVSLHTAAGASESSAAWLATELTTGAAVNYNRRAITAAQWSAPAAFGSAMISSTNVDITFPTAGSAWGLITHVALWDNATPGAGNLLVWWLIPAAKTINNGDVALLTSGQLVGDLRMIRHAPADIRTVLTVEEVYAEATARAGYDIPRTDIALAVARADMDTLYATTAARVEWAIWDQETPINGVGPAVVLGRSDYQGGEIYLIWIDDHLSILQPHRPADDAPIWADEAEEVAASHAAELVNRFVWDHLIEVVVENSTPPDRRL